MAKVSVITIFLNAQRFLEETIASVEAQSFEDWELILVDDGSTDRSSAIARDTASASGGRIRYFTHPDHANLGLAASRNRGLAEARGDYVLYIDSDDLLFPDALATLTAALDHGRDMALACAATLFWNWDPAFESEPDRMQDYRSWSDRKVRGDDFLAAMVADESLHPANCSTLIRRDAINAIGGFDPAFRGIYEDTSLMTELLIDRRVHVLRACLSAYRMHAASHCHTAESDGDYSAGQPNAARLRFLEWSRGYLAQRGLQGSATGRAVDRVIGEQRGEAATGRRAHLVALAASALRDPRKVWAKLFARPADSRDALATIETFYRGHGNADEADRVRARRIALR